MQAFPAPWPLPQLPSTAKAVGMVGALKSAKARHTFRSLPDFEMEQLIFMVRSFPFCRQRQHIDEPIIEGNCTPEKEPEVFSSYKAAGTPDSQALCEHQYLQRPRSRTGVAKFGL